MAAKKRFIVGTFLGFLLGIAATNCVDRSWVWQSIDFLTGPQAAFAQEKSSTVKAPPLKSEAPPYRGLDANLYMQISGEYRACCYQAYAWADRLVAEKISQLSATAEASGEAKPLAVVFDLDETVLDNGRFQTRQIREGWAYNIEKWSEWEMERGDQVELVPGAFDFITKLETLGIERIYITNRHERAQAETLATLERLGVGVENSRLLCASDATGSNKDSRRALVKDRFEVLIFVGDNLRDFDEIFRFDPETGSDGRKSKVDDHRAKFGRNWVILPNPAYGEWAKPLGKGESDANHLLPRLGAIQNE